MTEVLTVEPIGLHLVRLVHVSQQGFSYAGVRTPPHHCARHA
jgi:hypothetical protein